MVEQLTRDGALRTPEWREAFGAVPREVFVPAFSRHTADGQVTYRAGDPGFLEAVYADDSLTTQYDEHGAAISSSSQPTVMAIMAEALVPADDALPVLDLGTGPGYNAALLSHRYGAERVVSRDLDPALVEAAREHLIAAGCAPTLSAGDGAAGCPEHAPYAALIATFGVGRIPRAWCEQVAPGGNIVTCIGNGLVSLVVDEQGRVAGRFLPMMAAFMSARVTVDDAPAPPSSYAGLLATAQAAETRVIALPVELDARMVSFLGRLAQPDVRELGLVSEDRTVHGLIHPASHSWARLTPRGDGTALLEQDGPRDLWAERAPLLEVWHAAGRPDTDGYGLTVHPDGRHELSLGDKVWPLTAR